jgi:hypothetical protein
MSPSSPITSNTLPVLLGLETTGPDGTTGVPSQKKHSFSEEDKKRWQHVGRILRQEAAQLGMKPQKLSKAGGAGWAQAAPGRNLLANHTSVSATEPVTLLVRHTIVSRDAFLCANDATGSAIEWIGHTCGEGNSKIKWSAFRKLGDLRTTNKLCGLPGATPELQEYLGKCGVAPARLSQLPTHVCNSTTPSKARCTPKEKLLQKCQALCGEPNKSGVVCESLCTQKEHCQDMCTQKGRLCKVDSHRTCQKDARDDATLDRLACKAATFGQCTWRRCTHRDHKHPFWYGTPIWRSTNRHQKVMSPQQCLH